MDKDKDKDSAPYPLTGLAHITRLMSHKAPPLWLVPELVECLGKCAPLYIISQCLVKIYLQMVYSLNVKENLYMVGLPAAVMAQKRVENWTEKALLLCT